MNKEFKFAFKSLYKRKIKLIVLLNIIGIIIISILSFNRFKISEDEKIFIFMSNSLSINETHNKNLIKICKDHGMKEFQALGYDDKDEYFNQTFATKGYYGSDIYIFSLEVIEFLKESEAFETIDENLYSLTSSYVYDDDENIIALAINETYYVLVNKKRNKSDELINDLLEYLVLNGGDLIG